MEGMVSDYFCLSISALENHLVAAARSPPKPRLQWSWLAEVSASLGDPGPALALPSFLPVSAVGVQWLHLGTNFCCLAVLWVFASLSPV